MMRILVIANILVGVVGAVSFFGAGNTVAVYAYLYGAVGWSLLLVNGVKRG